MARQGTKAGAGRAGAGTTCRDTGRLLDHSSYHPCRQLLPDGAPCRQVAFQSCCSGSLQGTRCRVSRGAATLPHRLPLRSIPPQRFACGSSHSRGHGRPRSVQKSSRLRGKGLSARLYLSTGLLLLRQTQICRPICTIAYATSVSPPDEAVAWRGRRYWMLDEAGALPMSLHRE